MGLILLLLRVLWPPHRVFRNRLLQDRVRLGQRALAGVMNECPAGFASRRDARLWGQARRLSSWGSGSDIAAHDHTRGGVAKVQRHLPEHLIKGAEQGGVQLFTRRGLRKTDVGFEVRVR